MKHWKLFTAMGFWFLNLLTGNRLFNYAYAQYRWTRTQFDQMFDEWARRVEWVITLEVFLIGGGIFWLNIGQDYGIYFGSLLIILAGLIPSALAAILPIPDAFLNWATKDTTFDANKAYEGSMGVIESSLRPALMKFNTILMFVAFMVLTSPTKSIGLEPKTIMFFAFAGLVLGNIFGIFSKRAVLQYYVLALLTIAIASNEAWDIFGEKTWIGQRIGRVTTYITEKNFQQALEGTSRKAKVNQNSQKWEMYPFGQANAQKTLADFIVGAHKIKKGDEVILLVATPIKDRKTNRDFYEVAVAEKMDEIFYLPAVFVDLPDLDSPPEKMDPEVGEDCGITVAENKFGWLDYKAEITVKLNAAYLSPGNLLTVKDDCGKTLKPGYDASYVITSKERCFDAWWDARLTEDERVNYGTYAIYEKRQLETSEVTDTNSDFVINMPVIAPGGPVRIGFNDYGDWNLTDCEVIVTGYWTKKKEVARK